MNLPAKMCGAPVACTQEVAKLDQKQADELPEASTDGVPSILWVVMGLRGGGGRGSLPFIYNINNTSLLTMKKMLKSIYIILIVPLS